MSQVRQPSIHITVKDLSKVLSKLGIEDKGLANDILRLSKKYSLVNRNAIISKAYAIKQLEKEAMSDNALFKQMYALYSLTVRAKHKFSPKRLRPKDTRTLSLISSITLDALEFCSMNNLSQDEGFKIYLDIGLDKSPKLQVLHSSFENIQEIYSARLALGSNTAKAEELLNIYSEHMLNYTGQEYTLRSEPILLKFHEAAKFCEDKGIHPKDFITALFEGLEWKSGIPSPSMFASTYGIQLVYEYLGKNGHSKDTGFKSVNLKDIMK